MKILQNPEIPASLEAVHVLESALYEDCDKQIAISYDCILPPRPLGALPARLIGPNFPLICDFLSLSLSLIIKISHLLLVYPNEKPNERP